MLCLSPHSKLSSIVIHNYLFAPTRSILSTSDFHHIRHYFPQSLVPERAASVPSYFYFWFIPVYNEPAQTENSNFEIQTQRRENSVQIVTTSSLFHVYALI